jgi:hypothetical protein
LHAALRTASEARLWSQLALSLYHVAVALMYEAASTGAHQPTYAALRARALELLAAIADHPAAWHVCQARAGRLIDELQRELPAEVSDSAVAQGRQLDWQASIEPLLDELARRL